MKEWKNGSTCMYLFTIVGRVEMVGCGLVGGGENEGIFPLLSQ